MRIDKNKDTLSADIYLFFPGNCREAMKFYTDIFGGKLTLTTRGSVDPHCPESMKDLLIHANLDGGSIHLMGADRIDAGDSQKRVAITLSCKNEAKMNKIYTALSAGGIAIYPMKKEYWGDIFGSLTDKYGISWQLNVPKKKLFHT